jgi:hypothetical protein
LTTVAPDPLGQWLDAFERQNSHSLASIDRALVRFGLNHKLIALDGVKADLIGSNSASVPFDVNVVDNLSGQQRVRAAISKHRFVQSDPLLIRRLGGRTWLLVRDEKHEHSSIGDLAKL